MGVVERGPFTSTVADNEAVSAGHVKHREVLRVGWVGTLFFFFFKSVYIPVSISWYLLHLRALDKYYPSTISLTVKGRLGLRKKLEGTLKSTLSSQSARRSVTPE